MVFFMRRFFDVNLDSGIAAEFALARREPWFTQDARGSIMTSTNTVKKVEGPERKKSGDRWSVCTGKSVSRDSPTDARAPQHDKHKRRQKSRRTRKKKKTRCQVFTLATPASQPLPTSKRSIVTSCRARGPCRRTRHLLPTRKVFLAEQGIFCRPARHALTTSKRSLADGERVTKGNEWRWRISKGISCQRGSYFLPSKESAANQQGMPWRPARDPLPTENG